MAREAVSIDRAETYKFEPDPKYAAFCEGENEIEVDFIDVDFVDDIAIPVFASSSDLVQKVATVTSVYTDSLLRFGFVVNPAANKTEDFWSWVHRGQDPVVRRE